MTIFRNRIDYRPASLYEYFSGKDEIIDAVAVEGHLRLKSFMQKVPVDLPIATYLVEIGVAYIHFAVQNSDYFRLMFQSVSAKDCSEGDGQESSIYPPSNMIGEGSSFPILLAAVDRALSEGVIRSQPEFDRMSIAYALWGNASLSNIAPLLGTPEGATIAWAHFVAFDLLVGRWAYLDSLKRGVRRWIMAPILGLIFLFGPLGLLLYLITRTIPIHRRAALTRIIIDN